MRKTLIKNRNFYNYFLARNISNIGDMLHDIAIMVLIANYTNSIFISGVITSINSIVRVLSVLLFIKIIDKLDYKKLMIRLDIFYGMLVMLLFFLSIYNFRYFYLYIFEVFFSFIFSVYKITREKVLKSVLPYNKSRYISLIFSTENILAVLIPTLSMILLDYIDLRYFILINSFTFFISAYLTSCINLNSQNEIKKSGDDITYSIKDIIIKTYPYTILVLIIAVMITFISSGVKMILLEFIKEFNYSPNKIGIFQSIYTVGCILGSVIIGVVHVNKAIGTLKKIIFISLTIFLPYILSPNLYTFIIVILGYGFFFTLINGILQIYYQHNVNQEHLGFIRSIHTIVVGLIVPISMMIGNYILNYFNLRILFIVFILLISILILIIYIYETVYLIRINVIEREQM